MIKRLCIFGVCCLVAADEGCDATLEDSSLKGPGACTKDGLEKISDPQEKAIAECFYECASGYDIKTGDGNTALAVPKTKTCTKDLSPPIVIACKTVPLNCAKPFAEFPNGCSGVMTLVENPLFQIYVAFYSYCAQEMSGYKSVLDTSVVFDAKTVCSGTYNYNTQKGTCMGLAPGTVCDKAEGPPQPPAPAGMPAPFPLVGAGSGKCEASLMTNTMAGPPGCTKDNLEEIKDPQVKAITECFQECAAGYTLEWKVGPSWEAAVAVPKQQKCSKLPDIQCSEVVLLCSKPFGEFPNACAGTLPLSQVSFYVAFYSYGKEVDGKVTTILDTRVVASKDEVCSGMYSVNSGECMGLVAGDQSSQGVVAPPDPPADAVKNLPISKWPVPNVDPVTSSVTATSSTKPGDTTEKPTETPSETTETPPETTETPHEPTEKPSESTKAPEPEKDTGSGHILLWFLAGVLVVAVCVAAFFYHRRGRLMEDERQLRGEVELNTSVNRF